MGVNIIVYRVIGTRENGTPIIEGASKDIGWDSARQCSDRDLSIAFHESGECEYLNISELFGAGEQLVRPKNFEFLEQWANERWGIVEDNNARCLSRYMNLFNQMKRDEKLYIYFYW